MSRLLKLIEAVSAGEEDVSVITDFFLAKKRPTKQLPARGEEIEDPSGRFPRPDTFEEIEVAYDVGKLNYDQYVVISQAARGQQPA